MRQSGRAADLKSQWMAVRIRLRVPALWWNVDTPDLGSGVERREGSNPFRATKLLLWANLVKPGDLRSLESRFESEEEYHNILSAK